MPNTRKRKAYPTNRKENTMKKIIATAIAFVISSSCITACGTEENENTFSSEYVNVATVTEVNEHDITATDNDGHEWGFVGDGYDMGDMVVLIMDDNGTQEYVVDDIIIKVEIL